MKIVVLDGHTVNPGDNPWDPVAALGEFSVHDRTSQDLVLERAAGAEIILTNKTILDGPTIAALPSLRYIGVLATGYNVVDLEAAALRGIPVTNIPEYGSDAVAQHVFALLLELTNHVGLHDALVKGGEWGSAPDFCFWRGGIVELAGKRMGIVGFGRIGERVAEIARAFGMEVLAYNPRPKTAPDHLAVKWVGLRELFTEADVVSLHSPHTPENTGFVNRELISLMKRDAFLINTSRGLTVKEADLADALNSAAIAGAAVDVVSAEPIRPENPLLAAKNCIITPHMAWASLAARQRLMAQTAANIRAFMEGAPVNVVNKK